MGLTVGDSVPGVSEPKASGNPDRRALRIDSVARIGSGGAAGLRGLKDDPESEKVSWRRGCGK